MVCGLLIQAYELVIDCRFDNKCFLLPNGVFVPTGSALRAPSIIQPLQMLNLIQFSNPVRPMGAWGIKLRSKFIDRFRTASPGSLLKLRPRGTAMCRVGCSNHTLSYRANLGFYRAFA